MIVFAITTAVVTIGTIGALAALCWFLGKKKQLDDEVTTSTDDSHLAEIWHGEPKP